MSETVKFQTLELDQTYQVKSYSEPFATKFGDCCILLVSKSKSKETFELYATKLLVQYIKEIKSTKKFNFIVKEKNGKKFPFIEGYSQVRNWVILE